MLSGIYMIEAVSIILQGKNVDSIWSSHLVCSYFELGDICACFSFLFVVAYSTKANIWRLSCMCVKLWRKERQQK